MDQGAVIVTGAGRGIGLAIGQELATEGYDVALVDIDETLVKQAASGLGDGGRHRGYVCDISDGEAVKETVSRIQESHETIDVLVNNAGITRDGLFLRMKLEAWQRVLDINLTGTFNFTSAVAPIMMRQRKGRIISIASVIGIIGNAGQANYAASKAGVIALTKSVAKELGGRSITVNAVAPGFIDTDMTANLPEDAKAAMMRQIALKRFGQPQDVAGVVVFLLSKGAAYVTGQTIVCDGGMVF